MPSQQEVYDFYLSQGVAPHQAAALVGHMWAESGGNPTASHDKGTGFGLFGFRDPQKGKGRWTDLKKFAESGTGTKLDINDWKTQALFSLRELDTTEKKAGEQFYGAKDYGGAIDALTGYLRPQGYDPNNPAATHNYTGRYNFGAQLAGVSPLLGGAIAEAGSGGQPGDKITPTAPVAAPTTGLLSNAQQNKGFDYAGLLSSGMKQMAQADPASMGGGGQGGPPPMPNLPAHRPQMPQGGFQNPFAQQQPIQTQLPQMGGMGSGSLLAPNPNNDLQLRKLLSGLLSGG